MTFYVDDVTHKYGRYVMCHLWADTTEELLSVVDKIEVDRKWIQGHPELSLEQHKKASWIHFDIALSKKKLALEAGAILTDKFGPIYFLAQKKIAEEILKPEDLAYYTNKIASIERIRLKQSADCNPKTGMPYLHGKLL